MNRFRETRRTVGRPSSRWSFSAQGSGSSNEYSIGNDPDLVAWYDAKSSTITQADATERVSAWNDLSGHEYHLLQATAANQPILLPDTGVNYLMNFAGASQWVTTPSTAAVQLTDEDLDIRVLVTPFSTAVDFSFFIKDNSVGSPAEYIFYHNAAGGTTLRFKYSGAAARTLDSTVASPLVNFTRMWLRVNRIRSTGELIFYKSTSSTEDDTAVAWTQVGDAISGVAENCTAAANPVSVAGSQAFAGTSSAGKLYRVVLYKNGVKTADFNPADWVETSINGATAVSSMTGETWTLTSTGATPAQIVAAGQPSILFDGNSYSLQATFSLNQPETIILIGKFVSWTADDYVFDGISSNSMALFQNRSGGGGASPNIALYAGGGSPNPTDLNNATVGTYHIVTSVFNGDNSTITVDLNPDNAGQVGLNNGGGLSLGFRPDATRYANLQAKALAVFSSAKSQKQIDEIVKWMQGRYAL